MRTRDEVGVDGAESIGTGTFSCTGTLRARYKSAALMDKYLGTTKTALHIVLDAGGLSAPTGVGYVISMPAIKFTRGRRVAGGQNQDVVADMSWQAYRDETYDYMMQIARFGFPVPDP